ncbi:NUDIX domain-containing protein [Candidatus Woesearchaeota archaeon]|nr:MAG: NUDIX hydrolase [archaeon GW2011_AR18]MBS3161986.1 NUDIX domain-containing protein [Candidatus Woesearchaeota archaeon]HIH25855.1 NUDIX domain-containing protein [Nanoarchaeota archaeon]
MIEELSFGAVVFRKENNKVLFLLLYRKAHKNYIESWDFPRGLIQKNETPEETAKREIVEETSINELKFVKGFKEIIKWFYKKDGNLVSKKVTYFLAETSQLDIKISNEHDDFRWCYFDEACSLIKLKNTKEVLIKADEYLTGRLNKYFD